ncbi:MAG: AAA family ATPase [Phycisphaerales bacterium]|nr:MAG: AAA family ATPase [Phycisphaerales bacterium]
MAKKTSKKTTRKKTSKASPKASRGSAAARAAEAPPQPGKLSLDLKTFDRIVGQDRALGVLSAAMGSGRVHHAWVFHGPRGVGKFTTAAAFGAMLIDPSLAPDLSGRLAPDPDSPVRRLIAQGAHPDFHVVTKELAAFSREADVRARKQTNIPVEVLREFLIEPASRTRAMAGESLAGKVLILEEAHLLNREGQNVLLKTLEEPAPGTVIILCTSNEERLLPTVRSRCQRVGFTLLDPRSMDAWLASSGLPFARSGLPPWLEAMAGGSPGAVIEATEAGLDAWDSKLRPLLEEAASGGPAIALPSQMAALTDAFAKKAVEEADNASKEAANREAVRLMLGYVASWARLKLRGERADPERWASFIDAIAESESLIASNVRILNVMEFLVARLRPEPARR